MPKYSKKGKPKNRRKTKKIEASSVLIRNAHRVNKAPRTKMYVPTAADKFIHFGCWNRFDGTDGFQSVLRKVNDSIVTEPVDFVLVAGDNYYPEKKKDIVTGEQRKTIDALNLKAGFDALPKTVDVHLILGNHDVETGEELFVPNGTQAPQCLITNLERELVPPVGVDETKSGPKQTLNVFKTFLWNGHTAIVMFDTTLYELKDGDESLNCYLPFYTKKPTAPISVQDLIKEQEDSILKFITDNRRQIQNVVFVGHSPIVSAKSKMEKDKPPKNKISCKLFGGLLEKVHRMLVSKPSPKSKSKSKSKSNTTNLPPKYYYLCADVHLYQTGTVTMRFPNLPSPMMIKQYVVGTGGAELDDPPTSANIEMEVPDGPEKKVAFSYDIDKSLKTHGFLRCISDNHTGNIQFEFVSLYR